MSQRPDFLPPVLDLGGIWEEKLTELYNIFKKDFMQNKCYYDKKEIKFNKNKSFDDKEEAFRHLITYEHKIHGRIPDFKRAKKIHWIKPIIENHTHPEIKDFDLLERGKKIRKYLWAENYDFAVVLERKKNSRYFFLITAYHVFVREKMQKKYEKRLA